MARVRAYSYTRKGRTVSVPSFTRQDGVRRAVRRIGAFNRRRTRGRKIGRYNRTHVKGARIGRFNRRHTRR
jgi:hypothetical protein